MLKKLLTQNNFTELENAIKNKDFDLMVITCSNLSILKTYKLQSDTDIFDSYFNSEEINNTLYNHKIFDSNRISESKSSVTNESDYEEVGQISMLEEKPAFLRKREQKQEMLTKVKLNDPVELQVFIEVVTRTSILEHLNEGEKNKLIEEFQDKLLEQIKVKNQYYAKLPRPGAKSRLRNIIDKYVRGRNDISIDSISDLKKRIVSDGYLLIEESPDKQGNIRYKESEKLKKIFGKDLKNDSITDQSLTEMIQRSLNEVEITKLNINI